MNKLVILFSGLALAALPCTSALASDLDFSFAAGSVSSTNPTPFSASGVLTYTATGVTNQFLVTSGTGTINYNGSSYALNLLPVNGFAQNDNLFYAPPSLPFDFDGVAFDVGGSNIALSLYNIPPSDPTDYELLGYIAGSQISNETSTFNISPASSVTPEPGSLALLGTGALGAFGILRRKLAV